ncbi:hypothetical protein HAX54_025271 [Datura stramonium]|uniref:Uncharacterized protein n=1 Tax=Datura stramonium TaxID=4076 RepID=A0ABS8S625_DATST|nr:hypothetical protein [Datura stramonium]
MIIVVLHWLKDLDIGGFASGTISTKISEVAHQECSNAVPQTRNPFTPMVMLLEKCKGKGPQLLIKSPTKQVYDQDYQDGKGSFPLSVAAHVFKKRSPQGASNNHVDVSLLMKLLKSFFELAAIYDQARSTLHDKDMKVATKELSIIAGERLSNAILEEHEKIEKVSSICQSPNEAKEKIEKL